MVTSKYDIFSGHFGQGDAKWIEVVEGLDAAVASMKDLASNTPGSYFVFSIDERQIFASVDTTEIRTGDEAGNFEQTP